MRHAHMPLAAPATGHAPGAAQACAAPCVHISTHSHTHTQPLPAASLARPHHRTALLCAAQWRRVTVPLYRGPTHPPDA